MLNGEIIDQTAAIGAIILFLIGVVSLLLTLFFDAAKLVKGSKLYTIIKRKVRP